MLLGEKKVMDKNKKCDTIKERTLLSKWHLQSDKDYFAQLKKDGLDEYDHKYYLDEESWGDYLSFQQGSWDDCL
jgi:hypothetical protein